MLIGTDAASGCGALRLDPRVRRARALRRPAAQELLVGDAPAPGVLGRDPGAVRHPARRRGARRRRRRVPAEVPRHVRGDAGGRARQSSSSATTSARSSPCATGRSCCRDGQIEAIGESDRGDRCLPGPRGRGRLRARHEALGHRRRVRQGAAARGVRRRCSRTALARVEGESELIVVAQRRRPRRAAAGAARACGRDGRRQPRARLRRRGRSRARRARGASGSRS